MSKRFIIKTNEIIDTEKDKRVYSFGYLSREEAKDIAKILNELCQEQKTELEYYKRQFKESESKLLNEQRKNLKLKLINDNIRKCLDGV